MAYSDISQMPLTPDSARVPALESILRQEDSLAGKLLAELKSAYADHAGRLNRQTRLRLSPIAATVIERASECGTNIAVEVQSMREELASVREALAAAEQTMLYGSFEAAQHASVKWESVLKELSRAYGG